MVSNRLRACSDMRTLLQTCASEYFTKENRAPQLHLQLRLRDVSHLWEHHRVRQLRRLQRVRMKRMRRKVWVYNGQIRALHTKLHGMIEAYKKDNDSVTAEDWAAAVKGQEKKVTAIYDKRYTREKWPTGVPYLNFIA